MFDMYGIFELSYLIITDKLAYHNLACHLFEFCKVIVCSCLFYCFLFLNVHVFNLLFLFLLLIYKNTLI